MEAVLVSEPIWWKKPNDDFVGFEHNSSRTSTPAYIQLIWKFFWLIHRFFENIHRRGDNRRYDNINNNKFYHRTTSSYGFFLTNQLTSSCWKSICFQHSLLGRLIIIWIKRTLYPNTRWQIQISTFSVELKQFFFLFFLGFHSTFNHKTQFRLEF